MDLSGNVEEQERFSWQDASGKAHTVEAPAELKPLAEGVCIYLLKRSCSSTFPLNPYGDPRHRLD